MGVKIAIFIYSITPNLHKLGLCNKRFQNVIEYKINNGSPIATRKPQGIAWGVEFH